MKSRRAGHEEIDWCHAKTDDIAKAVELSPKITCLFGQTRDLAVEQVKEHCDKQ